MARFVPVKFKRVAAAFDEVAKARLCESSGSEYSPAAAAAASLTDLSGLVNSFLERGEEEIIISDENEKLEEINGNGENCFDELEIKENLMNLLGIEENSSDDLNKSISVAVENVLLEENDRSSPEFKRRLMTRLRDRGFDAGLCKSKWEKSGNRTSGSYEYIDINMANNRYIIEISLAEEFEIARPTACYTSLLEIYPQIFVGKIEELKQIVKIMCRAMKKSMKKMDIYVPPWRRLAYMQAKWFGSYKRTINEFKSNDNYQKNSFNYSSNYSKKRAVGFVPMPTISFYCRENIIGSNKGIKIGNLAAALNG
ncbi:uncharacterized protein LOC107819115 [Nicotiana tabacum]|uniref:Uncharacterized protein LOC107819115 n=1 Tax=Nicotiana tabacum TaxID=4097 RepID=A0A1S4CI45_TOBAC|nr:PREDICTED: uncharacterized protein LOC107819115 [Nicotiana tabacum]